MEHSMARNLGCLMAPKKDQTMASPMERSQPECDLSRAIEQGVHVRCLLCVLVYLLQVFPDIIDMIIDLLHFYVWFYY